MANRIFETKDKHYSSGMSDGYNIKIRRVSRWIQLEAKYITKRHQLWDYAETEDPEGKKGYVICFKHSNKLYALGQFMRLAYPMFFEDENGKTSFLSGYDATEYYYPYLIEIADSGEYVRLYEELREWEYDRKEDVCDG